MIDAEIYLLDHHTILYIYNIHFCLASIRFQIYKYSKLVR
jgi:hypothetical protein